MPPQADTDPISLTPNPSQAQAWIRTIAGDPGAAITWQVAPDRVFDGAPKPKILHGSLNELFDRLTKLNQGGAAIYACVNETDLKGRSEKNITQLRALFIDIDRSPDGSYGALPDLSRLPPNITVTSGNGQHAYWILHPGEPIEVFGPAQKALAQALGGDTRLIDPPRVMRVPGFVHNKDDPKPVTCEVLDQTKRHSIADVIDAFGAELLFRQLLEQGRKEELTPAKRAAIDYAISNTTGDMRAERCRRYLQASEPAIQGEGGDHRTIRIAMAGGDFGLSPEEFWPLLCEWNDRCIPPWSERELRRKLHNAYKYRKEPTGNKLAESVKAKPIDWRPVRNDDSESPGRNPYDPLDLGSEVEIAERFLALLKQKHDDIVTTHARVYTYDKSRGYWVGLAEDECITMIQSFDGLRIEWIGADGGLKTKPMVLSHNKCVGIYKAALVHSSVHKPEFFDKAPPGVVFANCFVRLNRVTHSIEEIPHSPEHRARHGLSFDWDPDPEFPEWLAFLRSIFDGDRDAEDKMKLLQEFVGACLVGIPTIYEKCLILNGEGSNGKSVLLDTIRGLFPRAAVSAVDPKMWGKGEYVAALDGAKLNLCGELRRSGIIEADEFKKIVSGEYIAAKYLYRNPFEFKPVAGHIFATNELPATTDQSHGFWRRSYVIEFNNTFSESDGTQIPKDDLRRRLDNELPGIITWALHGAARLIRNAKYTEPGSSNQAKSRWRQEADSVAAWLAEVVEPCDYPDMKAKTAYTSYKNWCEETGHKACSSTAWGKRLKLLGVRKKKTKHSNDYYLRTRSFD